ncbi:MAG: hydantoinase/oxoprolinase family protein [Gammaproteobacteria bacterium]|nr:hydantoinase/oxoprolinase family protein [Gammaproteobacteria bacterium]MBI5616021.1 hydantoinase/oxoprolinase family protein [Gammaproteobacteria bacterium]
MSNDDRQYILAFDAGGTMTDAILVKPDGSFTVGKSISRREDEAQSYRESVVDAAESIGMTAEDVHARCGADIYCGTGMLNTVLTGRGRKVGLLVTRGFEDITVMEGGLTYLGQSQAEVLHQQLHRHTRPLVDPKLVFGVSERMSGGCYHGNIHLAPGTEMIAVNERQVREATLKMLDKDVEVIGILFLYSFVDPRHEHRAKEIVESVMKSRGIDVPVVCSADVAPVAKENNRLKSLLFQCFAAELVRDSLLAVEKQAQAYGYRGRLLTLLSYGGAVNMEYPRLYETMISGPIGGLIGAQFIGEQLGLENVVTADMGGTSFDVGLLVDGRIGITKSADIAGHRLALPMVELDSVGSGAGSVVWVDEYKRLHVGPDSAGAKVGVCLNFDRLTVTDINVALGYVDPDYFLGGQVKLNREAALAALEEAVAKPLGLTVYEAGAGVLDIVNTQMNDLLRTMIAAKGYDTHDFTLLYYGGAGPVHMHGFANGIDFQDVITLPWAAGFSAFGAACAEYMHRYDRGLRVLVPNALDAAGKAKVAQQIRNAWRELEDEARFEMEREGADPKQVTFRYGIAARYIGQLESFDTRLADGHMADEKDVERLIEAFETMYTKVYPEGARFPDAGYSLTAVYLEAIAPKPQPMLAAHPLAGAKPSDKAYVESRNVYHGGQWTPFSVYEMVELEAGNVVEGPAIIRDPMTTVVIPPGRSMSFDKYRILHYR